jgi:Meiotically up-regulated gene 113
VVYFLRTGSTVKIGTSTRLLARVKSFSFSLADVALLIPGGLSVEAQYHQRFARQRIRDSEWFRVSGELLSFLTEHAPQAGLLADETGVQKQPVPMSSDAVGLRLAVKSGILTISLSAVRRARADDIRFPKPIGAQGPEFLYDPAELTAWEVHRPRSQ